MKKILLIDGNNISYMGHGRVMSHEGVRTETIFTGMNMVRGYLDEFRPDRVAVVWDGGRDPRRMMQYPEYKKRKEKTELEKAEVQVLYNQMDILRESLKQLGLTQFKVPGREADDVIYSLIKNITENVQEAVEFVVVTTDKDYFQLFNLKYTVKIFNQVKKKLWDLVDWEQEFGMPYDAYLDYKAIVGDPSDNLPGIKGIGPKGASVIIESMHGDKDEWTPGEMKTLTKFMKNEDQWNLMYQLMEFLEVPWEEVARSKDKVDIRRVDDLYNKALEIMNEFGFQRMLDKFQYFIEPFESLLLKEKSNE